MRIIVIHSFWRSSSTYFWNKLRDLPGVRAFCEPFHEILSADLTLFPQNGSEDGSLRHPLVNSYWDEYCSLGITPQQLFKQRDGSFQRRDYYDWTHEKASYLKRLIQVCQDQQVEVVVLGCVRSIAFAPQLKTWLTEQFPTCDSWHLLLRRDGYQQFQSGLLQWLLHGNSYFLTAHLEPMLAAKPKLAQACGFDPVWIDHFQEDIFSWAHHLPNPWINFARGYIANTTVCLARGISAMDICFDLDQMESDPEACRQVEKALSLALGRPLFLSDFRLSGHGEMFSRSLYRAIEEEVRPLALCSLECDLDSEMSSESLPSGVELLAAHLHALQHQVADTQRELADTQRELADTQRELERCQLDNQEMRSSTIWRCTGPLRVSLDGLKGVVKRIGSYL